MKSAPAGVTSLTTGLSGLRPYQLLGISFLASSDSALLADEMGLGKTVQTSVAVSVLRREVDRILLITPNSLCQNWLSELGKWAPTVTHRRVIGTAEDRLATYRLPIKLLVVSFEQLREDYARLPGDISFDLVIVDEAQRIKNASSEISLACRLVPRKRAWALTGTPLENRPDDLIAIYRFLRPGLLDRGVTRSVIHEKIRPFFLRRKKSDVLPELPPIIFKDVPLNLTPQQRTTYDSVWDRRFDSLRNGASTSDLLAIITKLKQICNYDQATQASSKLQAAALFVEQISAAGEKVLIFSQYVQTLLWLSSNLNIRNSVYYGDLDSDARDRVIADFKKWRGPSALLLSYGAGGVGLNLDDATLVILFDRWWNPAVEEQAINRAHRFGRLLPLTLVRFTIINSIEERINQIISEKRSLFAEYVDAAPSDFGPLSPPRHLLLHILGLPTS